MILRLIDTETCNLDGGIVEIASVDLSPAGIENPQSDIVKPDRPISYSAMAIHHITEEMVADKNPIEDILPAYLGASYYIAHNARFDRAMLPEMAAPWICTLKLARRLWPDLDSHSNQFLRYALKLDPQVPSSLYPHRALYDCYVTAELFKRIQKESGWTLDEMVQITEAPSLLNKIPFGKHRGRLFSVIAETDPEWLQWASKLPELEESMRFTLNHYLGVQP